MKIAKKAQSAINVFQCPIVVGTRKNRKTGKIENVRCNGTGFVPVTLRKLADIRTNGRPDLNTKFSCGHYSKVVLTP